MKDCVYILDDDLDLAHSLARLLARHGLAALPFTTLEALSAAYRTDTANCLLCDIMLAEHRGFEVAPNLRRTDPALAIVYMTAWPSTPDAVDAVKRFGGVDYLDKPLDEQRLLASVQEGLAWSGEARRAERRLRELTSRQRQVLQLVAQGKSSRLIAEELDLSQKTVEEHRSAIATKTGAGSLAELIRLAAWLQPR